MTPEQIYYKYINRAFDIITECIDEFIYDLACMIPYSAHDYTRYINPIFAELHTIEMDSYSECKNDDEKFKEHINKIAQPINTASRTTLNISLQYPSYRQKIMD